MNFSLFVAKRYFFAKQSKSIIHIITWIAVLGLGISTAAMVIVLSAFNGIESIVHRLYSDFDPEITISSKNSMTFDSNFFPFEVLEKENNIASYSKIIEEVVVIKKLDKIGYATLLGVEENFLKSSKIRHHIDQGIIPERLEQKDALLGIGLISKLDFYIFEGNPERITIYAPVRDAKISATQTPFRSEHFMAISGINYNKEVNTQNVLVDFKEAQKLLNYGNDISRLGIALINNNKMTQTKRRLQEVLGDDFLVKTNLEKNEIIYKTSKIEKIIVLFILVFIFILASFNMVASLTMMFIEKRKDMNTMAAFGLKQNGVFSIFYYQGLIINFFGILGGLLLGYGIIFAQQYFHLLVMPNSFNEPFPVHVYWTDFLLITSLTGLVGVVSAYLPVRYLIRKYVN